MMRQCDVQVFASIAGNTYSLNNFSGYTLLEYSGLGIANTRRLSQRGPYQHGDTDLGYRQDPRSIMISWGVWGDGDHAAFALEALRTQLFSIFRPREGDPVRLLFIMPDGRKRQADVNLQGAFDGGSQSYEGYAAQRLAAAFKASDPRLYHPQQQSTSFNLLSSISGLPIPFTVPIPIGESTLNTTQNIVYADGDVLAAVEYPTITIYGPITSPVIENLTTDETVSFTAGGGLTIGSGEFIVVNLNNKTALDQDGNAVDSYLSDDSDLAAFHLSYASEKLYDGSYNTDGSNAIRVQGDGVNLITRVDMTWYDRYEGV